MSTNARRRVITITLILTAAFAGTVDAQGRRLPRLFPRLFRRAESPGPTVSQTPPIPTRNLVNLVDRNLPTNWSVAAGKLENIKWSADLGRRTFGMPVVADGRVFATSTDRISEGIMSAFRDSDGKLLWRNRHPHPKDFPGRMEISGVPSTPTVDGAMLYYIVPGGEIICADSGTGNLLWRYDLAKELKVVPVVGFCHVTTLPLGSPLVVGDLLFAITGHGRTDEGTLVSPKAPSFVALHKKTGKLVWQSNLPGENIIDGQWSSPTFACVNNIPQVIFAGGDAVLYSFEPETGKLIWKCDCLPTRRKAGGIEIDHYIVGTPVVVGDRLHVGLGTIPEHPTRPRSSYFLCLDVTKQGDVSLKSYHPKAVENKASALIWAFGGPIQPPPAKDRREHFGPTISTAAVHDGLVYIGEEAGYLHCLDANTGRQYWVHDLGTNIWGSPYWADGKIYLGDWDGDIKIFAHGKTKRLIAAIDMDNIVQTTPVAANGVLYVMTRNKLYAIGAR